MSGDVRGFKTKTITAKAAGLWDPTLVLVMVFWTQRLSRYTRSFSGIPREAICLRLAFPRLISDIRLSSHINVHIYIRLIERTYRIHPRHNFSLIIIKVFPVSNSSKLSRVNQLMGLSMLTRLVY